MTKPPPLTHPHLYRCRPPAARSAPHSRAPSTPDPLLCFSPTWKHTHEHGQTGGDAGRAPGLYVRGGTVPRLLPHPGSFDAVPRESVWELWSS